MPSDLPPPTIDRLSIPPGQRGAAWPGRVQRVPPPVIHHRHAELEANLVLRGHGAYLIGDRRLVLRPGALVWLFPCQDHCLVERSADFLMHIAVWSPALVRPAAVHAPELAQRAPRRAYCRSLPLVRVRALARLIEEVAEVHGTPAADDGLAFLVRRLWSAYVEAPEARGAEALDPRVARIAHLLAGDDDDGADAGALARRVGLHADHLARLFRRQLGVPISAYRNRQRLERVLARWSAGANLLEAALAAGFGSYTHFHRVFRAHFGAAPRDYLRARPAG